MANDFTYNKWKDGRGHIYDTGPTFATIYFHGFLALCFNKDRNGLCEVGVHNKTSDHKVGVKVLRRGATPCEEVPLPLPKNFGSEKHMLEIDVKNPVKAGAYVYTPSPPEDAVNGRYSYTHYGLDMEGGEMHDRFIKKVSDSLWPRFRINNGLFYTCAVSQSKFDLKNTVRKSKSGSIGLVLAADIYLTGTGSIEFRLDGESSPRLTLPERSMATYEIAIFNSCEPTGSSTTTDFYKYYDVIDSSEVLDKYDVEVTDPKGGGVTYGTCNMTEVAPFSDPAPCLPVTFGRSPCLDWTPAAPVCP